MLAKRPRGKDHAPRPLPLENPIVKNVTAVLAAALALSLAACNPPASSAPKAAASPKTDDEKTVYALGVTVQRSLQVFSLTPAELELVIAGLRDAAAGKAEVKAEEKQAAIQALVTARRAAAGADAAKKGGEFLEKAAKEPGAVKTASGLVYIPLKEGTGPSPAASDKVKVNYRGQLTDGKVFDASDRHGGPASFPLNGVIPCWTEGVQKMKVGGKARLVCPASIAYGDRGAGADIPPGATLDFEVELLEILK
jgi:FKBP-type peptidyl-prolyl cis-trans isomerase FkpA